MPITIRMPAFGGIKGKEHHGESPETYYVHTAGLKVVTPSTPADAYRLLRLAIAEPDPVIVLGAEGEVLGEGEPPTCRPTATTSGAGTIVREGEAATVFTYGAMVARCLDAAATLAGEGVSTRVVDLRSLSPLDTELIARCVRETGRAVVVHEAPKNARARRRGHGPHRRRGVRLPRGAGATGDRLRRAVPARGARAALPAERGAHRGRRSSGGGLRMSPGVHVFAMPDLGEGLEDGEVVAWLVAEGDTVELNQPLVEVETAKATVEIPSPVAGIVSSLHAPVGATVPVGSPLVTFAVSEAETGERGPAVSTTASEVRATPPVRQAGEGAGGRPRVADRHRAAGPHHGRRRP